MNTVDSDHTSYQDSWDRIADLGQGGQALTIKAKNKVTSLEAAVKILSRQKDMERRGRMHREATALSTLKHNNIPALLESNTTNWQNLTHNLYLVTEFIPGRTLSFDAYKGKSLNEIIDSILIMCRTVEYFHAQGIIHRDIKPDNIILKNNSIYEPYIIDFGLSFNYSEADGNTTLIEQHVGNRFLMLPEQKGDKESKRDPRSDITSLVGIFYLILTGRQPTVLLDGEGIMPHQVAIAKAIIDALPFYQRLSINQLFDTGFHYNIVGRYQNISSLIYKLEEIKNASPAEVDLDEQIIKEIESSANSPKRANELAWRDTKRDAFIELKSIFDNMISELPGFNKYSMKGIALQRIGQKPSYSSDKFEYPAMEIIGEAKFEFVNTGSEIIVKLSFVIIAPEYKASNSFEIARNPILGAGDYSSCYMPMRRQLLLFIQDYVSNM